MYAAVSITAFQKLANDQVLVSFSVTLLVVSSDHLVFLLQMRLRLELRVVVLCIMLFC